MSKQKRFGRIVVSLRQEHRDPHTDNRWTQSQLGNAANLSEAIIGKIERGERVHLDSDTLLRLSNALDLHGAEQRAFFALGSAVGTTALPNANLSKQFRDRILHTAARVQAPCLLQNAFFDMIAVNDGWLRLYGLSGQLFAANYQSARVANWLGLLYDPQFSLRQLLGERWRALALESLQKFRITALPHRHLAHFNQLIARLRALPNFSVHWKDARTHLPRPNPKFSHDRTSSPGGHPGSIRCGNR